MMTIDDIAFKIELYGIDRLSSSIPEKDKKAIRGISKMMSHPDYITESQGNLLIKILKDHLEHLNFIGSDVIPSLKSPLFKHTFKVNEKFRKISINHKDHSLPVIEIDFSFNKEIKKVISELLKNIEGDIFPTPNKTFCISLTENNLVRTIDSLSRFKFERSEEIQALYDKLKSIDIEKILEKFEISGEDEFNVRQHLAEELGEENVCNSLLVNDRKLRYQYTVRENISEDLQNLLVGKIATRNNTRIFIDQNQYSLKEIFESLAILKRDRILLIFDEFDIKSCIENIKTIKGTLKSINFDHSVGVYFRFDNTSEGSIFNKLISEYEFNKQLDNRSGIAVLSNGKIPKFFLKSNWRPNTVISFTSSFRNNKTSIYCNDCDLVVYYSQNSPINSNINVIL